MSTVIEIPIRLDVQTSAAMGRVVDIFTQELRAAAEDIGLHVTERVKANMAEQGRGAGLWNTGALINSITWATEMSEQIVSVMVGTNLEYGKYKEFGTEPHFVPFYMAHSLYLQAKNDWGWVPPSAKEAGTLDPGRVWLKPTPDARPAWGVFVTGAKEPFLFPGWIESVQWIEARLLGAANRAAARCSGGES